MAIIVVVCGFLAASCPAAQPEGPAKPNTQEQRALGGAPQRTVEGAESSRPIAGNQPEDSWIGSGVRTAGALAVVVGLIAGAGLLVRKAAKAQGGLLAELGPGGRAPSGLLQVLGRYPVGRGATLVLLKLDRRILLLSQAGGKAGGAMTTLCEITDPEEVASILVKSRDEEGESLAQKFQAILRGEERTAATEFARAEAPAPARPRQADARTDRPATRPGAAGPKLKAVRA